MRLAVTQPATDQREFEMCSYHHVRCFRLPKKFANQGPNHLTPQEFVDEKLTDATDDQSLLPTKAQEIAQLIAEASLGGKKRKAVKSEGDAAEGEEDLMSLIKHAAEEEGEPPKKKIKGQVKFNEMLESYKKHAKTKADVLKDYLRYVQLHHRCSRIGFLTLFFSFRFVSKFVDGTSKS